MPYFIRDDRKTPQEAAYINAHRSPASRITAISPKLAFINGQFVHSAHTVLHVACANANIPGMAEVAGDPSVPATSARFDARDAWADQFGPGHALCWAPVWTNDPDRDVPCFFCGESTMGRD